MNNPHHPAEIEHTKPFSVLAISSGSTRGALPRCLRNASDEGAARHLLSASSLLEPMRGLTDNLRGLSLAPEQRLALLSTFGASLCFCPAFLSSAFLGWLAGGPLAATGAPAPGRRLGSEVHSVPTIHRYLSLRHHCCFLLGR